MPEESRTWLDRLADQNARAQRFGVTEPPSNGLRDLTSQQQMTHQPEQPNLATPYLQRARQFFTGSPQLRGLAGQFRNYLPQWMNQNPLADLYRNPEFEEAANLGVLKLGPGMSGRFSRKSFQVFNEPGTHVANLDVSHDPRKNELTVNWLGSVVPNKQGQYHSLGLREMRTLLPELDREFPGLRRISAYRAGGARHSGSSSGEHTNYVNLFKDTGDIWRVEQPQTHMQRSLQEMQESRDPVLNMIRLNRSPERRYNQSTVPSMTAEQVNDLMEQLRRAMEE